MSAPVTGEDLAYAAHAAHQRHRAMSQVVLSANWADPAGVRCQLKVWAKIQGLTPTERAELAEGMLSEVLNAAAALDAQDVEQQLTGALYGIYGYEDAP